MSTRERAIVCTSLHLSYSSKLNAPFKAPTPTMPASRATIDRETQEIKQRQTAITLTDDDDICAPPEDSSEDDGGPNRSDIVRTNFRPKESSVIGSTGTLNGRSSKKSTRDTIGVDSRSSRSTKRARDDKGGEEEGNVNQFGSGMVDELGFMNSSSSRSKRKPVRKFGAITKPPFGWSGKTHNANLVKRASQKSQKDDSDDDSSEVAFKNVDLDNFDSDDSPRKGFKMSKIEHYDSSPEQKATFKDPPPYGKSPDSAPSKKNPKKRSSRSQDEDDSDDDQPGFQMPEYLDNGIADTSLQIISHPQPRVSKDTISGAEPISNPLLETVSDAVRDIAEKDGYGEILQSLNGPVAITSSSNSSKYLPELYNHPKKYSQTVCPMCNEPVDAADLKAWGVMNAQRQSKFCRSHKKKAAKANWISRGYPDIDWENLDIRFSKHHSYIKKLINGASSHFGNILHEAIKSGKNRSMKEMSAYISPGYYGARGLRAITDNIMDNFSPLLKKRAVEDRLISSRGMTTYVQAVLVPEVACRLIKEDMSISIEEARHVMNDSIGDGELLNEEVKERVIRKDCSGDDDTYGQ